MQIEEIRGQFKWKSIIVWGHFEELEGVDAAKAMTLLGKRISDIEKMRHLVPVDDEISAILSHSIFYRIRIEKATGRSEGY